MNLFALNSKKTAIIWSCLVMRPWPGCIACAYCQVLGDDAATAATKALIKQHLEAMHVEWSAHRHESAVVVWPAGRTRLQRGTRLNIPQFIAEMTRYAVLEPAT